MTSHLSDTIRQDDDSDRYDLCHECGHYKGFHHLKLEQCICHNCHCKLFTERNKL